MADTLTLKVNGQAFDGWTSVSVHRSLETLSGGFSLGFTERYPFRPDLWRIEAGDACEGWIGKTKLFTGWVDEANYEVDAALHSLSVTGRDKTEDLIDCSAIHGVGSWSKRSIEQIASELARPFGIEVISVDGVGAATTSGKVGKGHAGKEPLKRMSLQQGETVWEIVERMARQRSVIAITNADGNVELRRPGLTPGGYTLEYGVNVLRARFKNDVRNRYSDYLLKGHPHGPDGDFLLGTDTKAYTPKASARDPGVKRYRPLLIINEETATGASLSDRAKWEATIRAGKAQSIDVTVAGWRTPAGDVFEIDRLVAVKVPLLGVNQELLVSAVSFEKSPSEQTVLTLTPKEAFSLVDLPAPKSKKKGKGVDPLLGLG